MKFHKLPIINSDFIDRHRYFLLFETSRCSVENFRSCIFFDPIEVLKFDCRANLKDAFRLIEQYSRKYFLAGYFAYELGYYFEKKLFRREEFPPFPLIHLGVFDRCAIFNHQTGKWRDAPRDLLASHVLQRTCRIQNLRFNLTRSQYAERINRIKKYITLGDTYEVNFAGKFRFRFSGKPWALFNKLRSRQSVSYGAFCKMGRDQVISLSPELFFEKSGLKILTKPMKGTLARGRNTFEDEQLVETLCKDAKNLAENIMIVDLLRNDLGRISQIGSVKSANLFRIERYQTLFQMTSTVRSLLEKEATYYDIFRCLFPGGSVTGAPKIRTMQIIRELERGPRQVYCGALGFITPSNKAIFNMPIRTIHIQNNQGVMGVGSGIVIDSDPHQEYQECLLKAKFLTDKQEEFQLIETILWEGKYKFLSQHLNRLRDSTSYFEFEFQRTMVREALTRLERKFCQGKRYRVRLLLAKDGNITTQHSIIEQRIQDKRPRIIIISKYRIDPQEVHYYHKTTNRHLYDNEYNKYLKQGCYDVLFLNKNKQVTEGAISNIIVQKNGKRFTPPVSCGLLAGIYRNYLIRRCHVKERILFKRDLLNADKIYLCNSVRGLTEVRLR